MNETERKQNLPLAKGETPTFLLFPPPPFFFLCNNVFITDILSSTTVLETILNTHTQSEEKRKIIYCLQSVLLVLPSSSPAIPTTAMAQQQRKNITQHVINCRQITGQKYRPCAWAINCKKDTDLTIVLLTIIFNNPPSPSLSSYTLLSHPFQDD